MSDTFVKAVIMCLHTCVLQSVEDGKLLGSVIHWKWS